MNYVALLRAVNLPGHNKVGMADLRKVAEDLGLKDVRSLLQSGNLVFGGGRQKGARLEALLEKGAAQSLGVATEFFVRSAEEWEAIVARNPFPEEAKRDPGHLLLLCLKGAVTGAAVTELERSIRDREVVRGAGREVYLFYPDGVGRSRLTAATIEKKLGTRGTGRNWNTVLKLGALVGA